MPHDQAACIPAASRVVQPGIAAWRDAAPPDPPLREWLEAGLMRVARQMAEEHTAWGMRAFANLVPLLSGERAHQAGALAQPLFAQWLGRLIDRDVMRVLAPERYDAWLPDNTAPLHDGDWPRTLRGFLEWLGNLHLLGREARGRACERAADPRLHAG